MKKAFTLIELLVVVAIIGILSAVGVVMYNGYTLEAKKQTTIASWKSAITFIESTFAQCKLKGSTSTIQLSATAGSISCATPGTAGNINAMADTFMKYFKEIGYQNPYNKSDPVIIRTGGGGDTVDGRLRLDETQCSNSRAGNEMSIWYKVHDNSGDIARIRMQHWCQ